MDASKLIRSRTLELLESAEKKKLLDSCTPTEAAAGTIYIACILTRLRITQRELSEISKVPISAIRKHYILIARGLKFY
ncbi:MAG: hypothetical protein RTV31_02660 [Candidatus Thorarchaeota archaeon]